ncbi:hypothetical protein T11_2048 [Trichinella zimbabwensis]|uniref:Uncharacterized protein n=1 Tax=Trichinella zimbabwensis TaxID=268475 RepID=A0A0V1GYC1_9BILA|nr:hypothetical protein T11_9945 [Trichinella zimbabwensis]KRZ02772.1 hypothetical protein T11_2048 [Trichinella zimbabwensis]
MSNGADRAMVLRVRRTEPFRQRLSGSTTGQNPLTGNRRGRRGSSGGAASRQGRGISSILLSPQPLTEALHSVCILRNRSAEEAKSIPAIRDEAAASNHFPAFKTDRSFVHNLRPKCIPIFINKQVRTLSKLSLYSPFLMSLTSVLYYIIAAVSPEFMKALQRN